MFQESVVPYLNGRFGSQGIVTSYRYGVYDIREIDLESTLMDLIKKQSNPTIALLIKKGYIEVRITAKAETLEAAQDLLNPWDTIIRERFRLSHRAQLNNFYGGNIRSNLVRGT